MTQSNLWSAGFFFVALFAVQSTATAQSAVPIRQRAVDTVTVKDGPRLCGSIVGWDADGSVSIVVRREWLKEKSAKFYAKEAKAEQARAHTDLTKLLERIDVWRKERAGEKDLLPLLEFEKKRVETAIAARKKAPDKSASEFMLISVSKKRLRSGFRQPPRQKLVALYAWRERLEDPETRKASDLLAELRKLKVDLSSPNVDLSDRLAPLPESDKSWAARQAIVEYDLLKRLRFQGTNDFLVQAGGDAKQRPDLSKLLGGMLNGSVNKLLAEALGTPKAAMNKQSKESFNKAVKAAEKMKVRGFRITRVNPDILTKRVTVEEQFVAKLPDGKWKPVWTYRSTVDATKARLEEVDRIKNDEQVKQALKTATALGLAGGKEAVETALRFGAATMEAQQKAEEQFNNFRDRYIKRLDVPPFRVGN